jgi:hypothetical protein
MVESNRMKCVGHLAHKGERRNIQKIHENPKKSDNLMMLD